MGSWETKTKRKKKRNPKEHVIIYIITHDLTINENNHERLPFLVFSKICENTVGNADRFILTSQFG